MLRLGGVRFQSMGGLKKFLSTRIFMSRKLQAPKARSCDCRRQEAPYDYEVWGSVVSSPSGVWGGAPETDAILNNFLAKWSTFWALVNLIFCNNQIEKRRLNLLNNYMKKF